MKPINPDIREKILDMFQQTEDNRIPRSEIVSRGTDWIITAMLMPETNLVTKPCVDAGGQAQCFERIEPHILQYKPMKHPIRQRNPRPTPVLR